MTDLTIRNAKLQDDLDRASTVVSHLKVIISGLVALLVVGFSAGIVWATFTQYERAVERLKDKIDLLNQQITKTESDFDSDIAHFKTNLSNLGEPSYETDVTNDSKTIVCEEGHVVTGVRFDGHQIWVHCSSLGRAVWNPSAPAPTAVKQAVVSHDANP